MGIVRIVYEDSLSISAHRGRQVHVRVLDDGLAYQIQQDQRNFGRLLLAVARYASRSAGFRPETVVNPYHDDKFSLAAALQAAADGEPVTLHVWQSECLLGNGTYHQATIDLLDELEVFMKIPSLLKEHSVYFHFPRQDLERWLAKYAPRLDPVVGRLVNGAA